ncbi:MAG: methyltransferase domain-containing protein [Ginsengibacter sp.]
MQKIKSSFEVEKAELLSKQCKDAAFYITEPVRKNCKNCLMPINSKEIFLTKKFSSETSIDFILCKTCGHFNGKFQDTQNYSKKLYSGEKASYGTTTYLKSASSNSDYDNRVKNIYLPKVKFFDSVTKLNKKSTKIFDMGCGAGYLIKSFQKIGFKNIIGSEISPDLFLAAKTYLPGVELIASSDKGVLEILKKFNGNVVCMIGVLEHLVYNDVVMKAIVDNRNIKYLFISVPKFSLSVYLELLSTDFFHRQLSSGHTHLYTEQSLKYLEKMYSLDRVGEWYFGTDIEDLRRLIFSNLNGFEDAKEYLDENFFSNRDSLQSAIDKTRFTSEVHLVYKIKR